MVRVLESGAPRRAAKLFAVMLHGRGRAPEEMVELAQAFDVAGVRYLCPEAPGNSWYPGRLFEPREKNQPALGQSLAAIVAILDELAGEGIDESRIVLCGFSQGACLGTEVLLKRPAPYAACLFFTGGLIGPPGTVWRMPSRIRSVPVLVTGSETDEWVPAWLTRETAAVLEAFGASVETVVYESRAHVVSEDEIGRGSAMLKRAFEQQRANRRRPS
jgi:phospholipase/carboxylesterase